MDGFTHNMDTAEDLMEDVFVKIITQKPKYRPKASFKTWLYSIAGNVARDWYRKQKKHIYVPIDDVKTQLAAAENMERQYLQTQRQIQLFEALRRIHTDYAQALYLAFFEDFKNTQIAAVMHKSNRQVENLLYRAKQALRSELEKEGFVYEELS